MMNILHVTPSFYPATYWGGPIFSTAAICKGVESQSDMTVRVLTTNSAGPGRLENLKIKTVPKKSLDGYQVYFTKRNLGHSMSLGMLIRLPKLIFWADVVHLTGTYSFPTLPTFLICKFIRKPVVWSPRGALQAAEQWAGVSSSRKKLVFEAFIKIFIPRSAVLLVTAPVEKQLSLKRIPGLDSVIIPNGVDVPKSLEHREWKPNGKLRLMFISRIHEKKGLENLFAAMVDLPDVITLDIYGTGDSKYIHSLENLTRSLGIENRVKFHGHVGGLDKKKAFMEADIFVLPSHSENFGIVIAEALAHGVPVIASKATPWEEIVPKRCGKWIENDPGSLRDAILDMQDKELSEIGNNGRFWMKESFDWKKLSGSVAQVYRDLKLKKKQSE